MIYTGLNRTGEIETVKANGGADVAEVYGGIGESNPIFYSRKTITGTSPLTFKGLGQPLTDCIVSGNAVQDGTPTPEAPVDVQGCGEWGSTKQQYKLPLTVNGTEYPIYIGQVPTTRMVKKLVLTGEEIWYGSSKFRIGLSGQIGTIAPICTHYRGDTTAAYANLEDGRVTVNGGGNLTLAIYDITNQTSIEDWKSYLAAQYAAGTPVTVWYVLATPETAVVNEPLMKIGDYADTVSMAQAGVTLPTVAGANTLTVGTTVQPSAVSITGNIKEVST
jgi:hypothetical protein